MTADNLLVQLRKAIKEPHAAIHRLNLSRIALCLPPQVHEPYLYKLGISRYAELYYGLEEAWVSCMDDPADWICDWSDEIALDEVFAVADDKHRVQRLLRLLYIPELPRTRVLDADLCLLRSLSPCDQVSVSENVWGEIRKDIFQRIMQKPHLLVAYTWILYSAILFGGREIRSQLLKAGPEFWGLSVTDFASSRTPAPLSFWNIDDDIAVRARFRHRIARADRLLTNQERQDVLDESAEIFRIFELLTRALDEDTNYTDE
ncbi:hypothetical protein N7532_001191 [Penicillium argentinense]|uniref:Heme oxygenase-like protein n=1 Tax=Penicillium argentinense TaxID=1131581 RepID=A0A9W9KM67_9EURO|nr:uncharacterized protein N7532_001191 [Penicillium argentinense]KAJ5110656.1 hypothetical protein N7532_001191 [Penicillium argentinense]